MSRKMLSVVTAFLVIALAAPAFAASTSPGNNSAFASLQTVPLPPFPAPLLTASIAKGKKKKVLAVEAMLTNGPYSPIPIPMIVSLSVDVNGVPMEPTTAVPPFGAIVDCGAFTPPVAACTVTGTWWLDFDTNLGLVGVPLTITLRGGVLAGPGVGSPVDVTMTVRMEKK